MSTQQSNRNQLAPWYLRLLRRLQQKPVRSRYAHIVKRDSKHKNGRQYKHDWFAKRKARANTAKASRKLNRERGK